METPVQTAVRLLSALEDFASQEANLVRTMDFVEAVAVQERAFPLVRLLAELAEDPGVAALKPQVAALLARREQNRHFIDAHLERLQSELRRIDEARARLARLAPAYGAGAGHQSARLNSAA